MRDEVKIEVGWRVEWGRGWGGDVLERVIFFRDEIKYVYWVL